MVNLVCKIAVIAESDTDYLKFDESCQNQRFAQPHMGALGMDFSMKQFTYSAAISLEFQLWKIANSFKTQRLADRFLRGARILIILPHCNPDDPRLIELITKYLALNSQSEIIDLRGAEWSGIDYTGILARRNLISLIPADKQQQLLEEYGVSSMDITELTPIQM